MSIHISYLRKGMRYSRGSTTRRRRRIIKSKPSRYGRRVHRKKSIKAYMAWVRSHRRGINRRRK